MPRKEIIGSRSEKEGEKMKGRKILFSLLVLLSISIGVMIFYYMYMEREEKEITKATLVYYLEAPWLGRVRSA